MRYLAVDLGIRRTGLAICDADEKIASPLTVIQGRAQLVDRIKKLVDTENIGAIVIGLPLNMDGTQGRAAADVRRFAKTLAASVSVPLYFHDERLSTFEAQDKLAELPLTVKARKKRLDAVAAAAILQSFIDNKKQISKPAIRRFDSPAALAHAACGIFIEDAQKAIAATGIFRVALCGGRTPVVFFDELSSQQSAGRICWPGVHIFWVDERLVPPESPDSNYGLAQRHLLSRVPIPSENIHRIIGEEKDYQKAADDYQDILQQAFAPQPIPVFDLIILGLGSDGHIGSLFADSPALYAADKPVALVNLSAPSTPHNYGRITLTIPVLQEAVHLMVMITGPNKADIVRRIFTGTPDTLAYPVHALWPVLDRVSWLIDSDAAKLIP